MGINDQKGLGFDRHIEQRLESIFTCPRMWGDWESIEFQILLAMELYAVHHAPNLSINEVARLIKEPYRAYLQESFGVSKLPVYASMETAPEVYPPESEEFETAFVEHMRQMYQNIRENIDAYISGDSLTLDVLKILPAEDHLLAAVKVVKGSVELNKVVETDGGRGRWRISGTTTIPANFASQGNASLVLVPVGDALKPVKGDVLCEAKWSYPWDEHEGSLDECPRCGGWLGPLDSECIIAAECTDCDTYFSAEHDENGQPYWGASPLSWDVDEEHTQAKPYSAPKLTNLGRLNQLVRASSCTLLYPLLLSEPSIRAVLSWCVNPFFHWI